MYKRARSAKPSKRSKRESKLSMPATKRRRRPGRKAGTGAKGGLGGRSDGIQKFNTRGNYYFNRSSTVFIATQTMPTLGNGVAGLFNPTLQTIPQMATFSPVFQKVKINSITYRFELITNDQTDDSVMPTIYLRKNQDPDLVLAGITSATMMASTRCVKKTFSPTSNILQMTVYPVIMVAGLQVGSGYQPMPRRAGFIDVSQDITHYGLAVLFMPSAANQVIQITAEFNVTWANPSRA